MAPGMKRPGQEHPQRPRNLGGEAAPPWDRPAPASPGTWATSGRWVLQKWSAPTYRRKESSRSLCVCVRGGFPASRLPGLRLGNRKPSRDLCWPQAGVGHPVQAAAFRGTPHLGPVLLDWGLLRMGLCPLSQTAAGAETLLCPDPCPPPRPQMTFRGFLLPTSSPASGGVAPVGGGSEVWGSRGGDNGASENSSY